MNKVIIGIGLLIGAVFAARAGDAYTQAGRERVEMEKLNKDTEQMKNAARRMAGFADSDLPPLEENVRRFYEAVDILSHYRGIKSTVHLEGAGEQGTVTQAFKPSAWLGVMKADVKTDLPDISGMDQNTAILVFMHRMEQDSPLRVTAITYQGKGSTFNVELYGVGAGPRASPISGRAQGPSRTIQGDRI